MTATTTFVEPLVDDVFGHDPDRTSGGLAGTGAGFCVDAGTGGDATPEGDPGSVQTQQSASSEASSRVVRLCARHGREARRKAVAPLLVRMRARRQHLKQVRARVQSAERGSASREDLAFLGGYCQDYQRVARLLEGEMDPQWQQVAAQLEELSAEAERWVLHHLR